MHRDELAGSLGVLLYFLNFFLLNKSCADDWEKKRVTALLLDCMGSLQICREGACPSLVTI